MKCPHCGYQDYRASPVSIPGVKEYVQVIDGEFGDFFELQNVIIKRSLNMSKTAAGLSDHSKAVLACPAKGCGKLFIEV